MASRDAMSLSNFFLGKDVQRHRREQALSGQRAAREFLFQQRKEGLLWRDAFLGVTPLQVSVCSSALPMQCHELLRHHCRPFCDCLPAQHGSMCCRWGFLGHARICNLHCHAITGAYGGRWWPMTARVKAKIGYGI